MSGANKKSHSEEQLKVEVSRSSKPLEIIIT
nr:MAG TPA: hypothetical protein [Caudoviricetes sp.]